MPVVSYLTQDISSFLSFLNSLLSDLWTSCLFIVFDCSRRSSSRSSFDLEHRCLRCIAKTILFAIGVPILTVMSRN